MPLQGALVAIGVTFAFLFGPLRWLALRLFTGAERTCIESVGAGEFDQPVPAASGRVRAAAGAVGSRQSRDVPPRRGRRLRNGMDGRHRAGQRYPGRPQRRRHSSTGHRCSCSTRPGVRARTWARRTPIGMPPKRARTSPARSPKTTCRLTAIGRISPEVPFTSSTSSPINRSIRRSGRRTHDRPGENMAVGPCGVSVGPSSHGLWLAGHGAEDVSARLVDAVELPAPFVPRRDSQDGRGRCADERHAAQRLDVDFGCGVVTWRVTRTRASARA